MIFYFGGDGQHLMGTYRKWYTQTCKKCLGAIHFRLDGGPVKPLSPESYTIACPYCGKTNIIPALAHKRRRKRRSYNVGVTNGSTAR